MRNWPYYIRRLLLCLLFAVIVSCGKSDQAPKSDQLVLTPAYVDFGSSSSRKQLQLHSKNNSELSWRITTNKPWLSVSPNQGVVGAASQVITVSIDRSQDLSAFRTAAITLVTIQKSAQSDTQSETIIPVKLVIVNITPVISTPPVDKVVNIDSKAKQKLADEILPMNLTKPNFVENGAAETNSKTVTLKVSASDVKGIAAYAIFDVDAAQGNETPENNSLQAWVQIEPGKNYNAILTYRFKHEYKPGTEVVVGVVFINIDGSSSLVVRDSIIFMADALSGDMTSDAGNNQSLQQESLVMPDVQLNAGNTVNVNPSGDVFSISGPGSMVPANGSLVSAQSQSEKVEQPGNTQLVYAYNFEQGYSGWWVDNGQWQIGAIPAGQPYRCSEGEKCAGTVLLSNYVDYVESRLVTPAIFLTPPEDDRRILLTFVNWYAVHLHDLVRLQISEQTAPGQWTPWKTLMTHSGSSRRWKLEMMGITNYAGKTVRFAFNLYQSPDQAGTKQGWYVDDVKVMIRP